MPFFESISILEFLLIINKFKFLFFSRYKEKLSLFSLLNLLLIFLILYDIALIENFFVLNIFLVKFLLIIKAKKKCYKKKNNKLIFDKSTNKDNSKKTI